MLRASDGGGGGGVVAVDHRCCTLLEQPSQTLTALLGLGELGGGDGDGGDGAGTDRADDVLQLGVGLLHLGFGLSDGGAFEAVVELHEDIAVGNLLALIDVDGRDDAGLADAQLDATGRNHAAAHHCGFGDGATNDHRRRFSCGALAQHHKNDRGDDDDDGDNGDNNALPGAGHDGSWPATHKGSALGCRRAAAVLSVPTQWPDLPQSHRELSVAARSRR